METTKPTAVTHNMPHQPGEVPGAVVGEYPQAAYDDPAAEYARALERADKFLAGIGTSAEDPAYHRHMAEKAAADEAAEKARISAEVAREAQDIRSGVYSEAHLKEAKRIAEMAQKNGGRLYIHSSDPSKERLSGWDAVQVLADHAGKQAQEAHDRMIDREIAFTGAKDEADWDEIVRVMDEAFGTAEKSDDWREFEGYAKRLSPKMQGKYADHRESMGTAPKAGEPEPAPEPGPEPTPEPEPPAKPPKKPEGPAQPEQKPKHRGVTHEHSDYNLAARARLRRARRTLETDDEEEQLGTEPIAQPVTAQKDHGLRSKRAETGSLDPTKGWRKRFPKLIDFANRDIAYERPAGKGRWSRETMKHWASTRAKQMGQLGVQMAGFAEVPGGDYLGDPKVAKYYRAERYGIPVLTPKEYAARAAESQEPPHARIKERPAKDQQALDMVRRLSLQGDHESDDDYQARTELEFKKHKRAWRRLSQREPLSENFDLAASTARIQSLLESRSAELEEGDVLTSDREEFLQAVQNEDRVTRREAEAIERALLEREIVTEAYDEDDNPYFVYKPRRVGRGRLALAA